MFSFSGTRAFEADNSIVLCGDSQPAFKVGLSYLMSFLQYYPAICLILIINKQFFNFFNIDQWFHNSQPI